MKTFKRRSRVAFRMLCSFISQNLLPKPNIESLMSQSLETIRNGKPTKKILYIALKYDYGDPKRGLGYEEYNFFYTLKNMQDVEIVRFDFFSIYYKYGKKIANQLIKEIILLEGIDTLFLLHYKDFFDHEMLKDLSENYPVETVIWLFDDDKRHKETAVLARCFNKVVTTIRIRHEERIKNGMNSVIAQFAANQYLYKNFNLKKKYDVVFIGQNFGNREQYMKFLQNNGIKAHAFGGGWAEGKITQTDMITIFNQAKIVLNFSSSAGHPDLKFLKGRVFEIPATGAFLLTEECEELEDFFTIGKDLDRFKDEASLLEKVRYYLANDKLREEIASNGQKLVLEKYTFETYLRKALEL